MAIPDFRDDGYLPLGLHRASEVDVEARFGRTTGQRTKLMAQLSRWLELCRSIRALRFLVNGSFVTAKPEPKDVDCVCWLPRDFEQQYEWGKYEAFRLREDIYRGEPKEIYPVFDQYQWDVWVEFFGRTREPDGRRKGIVEVSL
jgi:hypothetical protein